MSASSSRYISTSSFGLWRTEVDFIYASILQPLQPLHPLSAAASTWQHPCDNACSFSLDKTYRTDVEKKKHDEPFRLDVDVTQALRTDKVQSQQLSTTMVHPGPLPSQHDQFRHHLQHTTITVTMQTHPVQPPYDPYDPRQANLPMNELKQEHDTNNQGSSPAKAPDTLPSTTRTFGFSFPFLLFVIGSFD